MPARSAETATAEVPPAQVAGYHIQRRLGAGAFGTVWLAVQMSTGKRVAIKFYQHQGGLDLVLLKREVENLAVLSTARDIVHLLDVGWSASPPYLVMEYLPRGSLEEELAAGDHAALPVPEAVDLLRGIAQALSHMHERGILHCDLKPANVLLDQDRKPLLADFGHARLSSEQDPALGTFFYMAPEQASLHAAPSVKWDVYALGAIFYRMVTGNLPHCTEETWREIRQGETLADRLARYRALVQAAPPPDGHRRVAGMDHALADSIDRCLAADPGRRWPDVRSLLGALDARELRRRRRPLIALGTIGPALVLLVAALFGWSALNTAVRASSQALTRRLLLSSHFAAEFAAESAARKIERRWQAVEQAADEPRLRQLLQQVAGRPAGHPLREELQQWLEARRWDREHTAANSWFLTDASGLQLARHPRSQSIDRNFAFRDYFHGRGRDLPRSGPAPPPLERSHLSVVFVSENTRSSKVTFSTPVWSGPEGEPGRRVLGVLGMSVDPGYFGELPPDRVGGNQQVAVMIDLRPNGSGRRGQILQHPHLAHLFRQAAAMPTFYLDEPQVRRLEQHREASLAGQRPPAEWLQDQDHRDPIGGPYDGRWLATMAPVRARGQDTGWVILVQERYAEAIQPIADLRRQLLWKALWALGAGAAALTLLWGIVIRALSAPSRTRAQGTARPPVDMAIASTLMDE